MPRLFIAIDLPEPTKQAVVALCAGVPGARWVDSDQLHLTLRFIGKVDGVLFDDIADGLAGIDGQPFPLAVRGVGHFPPRGHPKVLWTGIDKSEPLTRLYRQIDRLLQGLKVEPEERKFTPHITLARLNDAPLKRVAEFLEQHSLFNPPAFQVEEFHLYSSALSAKGAVHTKEYSYPLLEKANMSFREKWQRGLV